MPRGIPRIWANTFGTDPLPQAAVIGTIPTDHPVLDPTPQGAEAQWQSPNGTTVALQEEPPPWELDGGQFTDSDARRYVTVPAEWTLRWINPRLLESQGWRYWRPVLSSDARVTVLVDSMAAPDGNIRRGGGMGDILAWMPTHWVVARRKLLAGETARQTQSAVDRQQMLAEQMRGSGVTIDSATHPRYTQAEGRTLRD